MNDKNLELIINDYIHNYNYLLKILNEEDINKISEKNLNFISSVIEDISIVYLSINNQSLEKYDIDLYNLILKLLFERKKIEKSIYTTKDLNNVIYQIGKLKLIKQPEQRTPEWYKYRNNRLTASDLATAVNKNPYGNRKKLIASKCGYQEKFITGSAIIHGIKFEPIAIKIYEILNKVNIFEYGCIPHSSIDFFGASPDGICDVNSENKEYIGRMLEIKCPKSRPITGFVPEYYELQIQGQLEVCNLDYCDYLECDIKEYYSYEDFINSKDTKFKGITIEKFNTDIQKTEYIYKFIDNDMDNIEIWEKKKVNSILKTENYVYIKTTFWKLNKFNIVLVKRDKKRFDNVLYPLIKRFWDEVLTYRKNGYSDLVKKKSVKFTNKSNKELTFLSDSE